MANLIVAQLLFLEAEDREKDISLYLDSPGGVITAGMCISDTMQFIEPQVAPRVGQACWMGASLTAGATGKRFCCLTPRDDSPATGRLPGQATDTEIRVREILKVKARMNDLLAHHTGKSVEENQRDTSVTASCPQQKRRNRVWSIIHTPVSKPAGTVPLFFPRVAPAVQRLG
ncbi:ATP-dependent Clp protease proteolytic subunit [Shigella flexneri]